ncbi:hypothetical protein phiCbK_299 [Caulobacter phage phiCbK]|uniref:Uncharacterized protein n=5 Tax=Viruses TaxID=10239 RepID=J3SVX0_9CAUD|nr:hypothetical protein D865_gp020 [Caulobacter phage phiCbK]YP_006988234.1 hypothetical protein D865_gp080 [Caulobacter phage phiCbK]ARB14939.1 hypothetical protein Ccr32_gp020 [Caulobacter phage Ccr32]ARB15270.1 hypothetical protein Ccr34_gp021 [Caulobacter phage Ccr34]AFO71816.1 hypothetical protein phiCbK_299 [Caulobacter phage phiCbK]AFU86852.1 hypothetical protein CbK_gp020 [Caulobacter phage phiCbK]AFU87170.1 hypothetical protein CbK_gp338 [Caulobacter phage phiCbK]
MTRSGPASLLTPQARFSSPRVLILPGAAPMPIRQPRGLCAVECVALGVTLGAALYLAARVFGLV